MRRHRPQKSYAMSGHGNIGMKPARHQYRVALAHYGDKFRILHVVVYQLNAIGRLRHIEVHVHLFQHLRVLMRWPARPVPGIGVGKACYQAARLHVLRDQHIQLPRRAGAPGAELQPRVSRRFRIAHNLEGIFALDIGREFGDIRFAFSGYLNRGIAWNVDGVVLPEFEFTLACSC